MMDDEVSGEVLSNEAEGTCGQFALLATASLAAKPTCAMSSEDVEDPTTQVSAADAEPYEKLEDDSLLPGVDAARSTESTSGNA